VTELDARLLMRRTQLLLRCYPRAYRAHRGEEILDTLLETTRPGRGWPPSREVASVIGGGLRARRATNLGQGLPASLRHIGILTAAMIMAETPAALLLAVSHHISSPFEVLPAGDALGSTLGSLLVVIALAGAWCGRRWLVAAAVGAAAVAAVASRQAFGGWSGGVQVYDLATPGLLALLVLLPLTRRRARPPRSLLWLPCLPLAASVVAGFAMAGLYGNQAFLVHTNILVSLLSPYDTYMSLVPLIVAVCWLATDVRPLAAVTLQFLLWKVFYAACGVYSSDGWAPAVIVVGLSAALVGALVWLLRHRARTTLSSGT
jgi:hypothetical protein